MLCDDCLKEIKDRVYCHTCMEKEQTEGDKLAVRLAKVIAKLNKLKEEFKTYKKLFN